MDPNNGEIITINVGQAGIQLGECVWKQYVAEHNITNDGKLLKKYRKVGPSKVEIENNNLYSFFEENKQKQHIPRNLMVDLETNVIDDIKTSNLKKLFNSEYLLSGKEDAANIFARGHYTLGKEIICKITNNLRKLAEHCDNIQGFVINHSVGGGTGSGLGALILERLAVDYRKKIKLGFEMYPSSTLSTCVVEPYNALLSTHWLLDHTDISLVIDNEALYELCQRKLDINRPSYDNINKLITKSISAMTASLRTDYNGGLNEDLKEMQTNLIPFPRLHFLFTSMAPIATPFKMNTLPCDVQSISDAVCNPQNFFTKISDFNYDDKYMAINMNYFGDVRAKKANQVIQWLKVNKKVPWCEWGVCGFKVGIHANPPKILSDDVLGSSERNVFMVANNTAMSRVFMDDIVEKYDLMYAQRAYVHWYVGEAMEEKEFAEARENLGFLEKDYLDILCEQITSTYSDDESDNSD